MIYTNVGFIKFLHLHIQSHKEMYEIRIFRMPSETES